MKYKDLIEKLKPFANEEVDIVTYIIANPENNTIVHFVRFHKNSDGSEICGIKQRYNNATIDNVGVAEFL